MKKTDKSPSLVAENRDTTNKLKHEDFSKKVNTEGYQVTYKGKNIGGAGIIGKSKSRGKGRVEDMKNYSLSADRDIESILNGSAAPHFYYAINNILNPAPATPVKNEGYTPGQWEIDLTEIGKDKCRRAMVVSRRRGWTDETICVCSGLNGTEPGETAKANAKLIASAPELFQMVIDLNKCIKRLTQEDFTQFEKDREAEWVGEAHELLTRINPNYYKNANE